jgi:hypothetical protein
MADAYRYAEGGPPSREIRLMQYIDRYGCDAVLGRKMYAREIRRINVAENVIAAHRSLRQALNYASWATEHPDAAALLARAERLAQELYPDG